MLIGARAAHGLAAGRRSSATTRGFVLTGPRDGDDGWPLERAAAAARDERCRASSPSATCAHGSVKRVASAVGEGAVAVSAVHSYFALAGDSSTARRPADARRPRSALPLAGLALLLVAPALDVDWEHHPSHFWLVLATAAVTRSSPTRPASRRRRRGDARVLFVSLAFLSAAGFLGLHALATPGVLLDTPNPGFVMATPVGLARRGAFAASGRRDLERRARRRARSGSAAALLVLAGSCWAGALAHPCRAVRRAVARAG